MAHVPNPRPTGDFRTSYARDRTLFATRFETNAVMFGALFVLISPFLFGDYILSQLIMIGIYGIAALGLNVLTGMTGQISLGHGAFFGLGAFASAWFSSRGIPVLFSIPMAGVLTMAVGMVFGIPAARLKGSIWRSRPWRASISWRISSRARTGLPAALLARWRRPRACSASNSIAMDAISIWYYSG